MASRCGKCNACKSKGCDVNKPGACIYCKDKGKKKGCKLRPHCIRATEGTYTTTDGNTSGSESERRHHYNTRSVTENSDSGPSETDSRTQFAETAEHIAENLIPLRRDHIPVNIPESNVITNTNSLDTTLVTNSSNASTVSDGAAICLLQRLRLFCFLMMTTCGHSIGVHRVQVQTLS